MNWIGCWWGCFQSFQNSESGKGETGFFRFTSFARIVLLNRFPWFAWRGNRSPRPRREVFELLVNVRRSQVDLRWQSNLKASWRYVSLAHWRKRQRYWQALPIVVGKRYSKWWVWTLIIHVRGWWGIQLSILQLAYQRIARSIVKIENPSCLEYSASRSGNCWNKLVAKCYDAFYMSNNITRLKTAIG